MKAFYSDRYVIDLPEGHTFPIIKYSMIRDRLLSEGSLDPSHIEEPGPASRDTVLLVHTEDYYDRLVSAELSEREIRRLGLPWSEALVARAHFSVAGTLAASRAAMDEGAGANLGGGTHHAFADRGEAFCVFNDIAIAIRHLKAEKIVRRAAVIDCDVHQGNGTARIFSDEAEVFTLSLHGANNYPLLKEQSTLDIALSDRADDESYLSALELIVPAVLDRFRPDIVFYQAGVDPFFDDRLGRLALTIEGLRERDRLVFESCSSRSIPTAITLGGGYARDVRDTVEAHSNTIRQARAVFKV